MAQPKKLTADILAGIVQTEDLTIDLGGEEYSVVIRPLTVAERGKVEALAQKGMKLRGNVQGPTAELSDVVQSQHDANVMCIAHGMVEPEMSVTQINKSRLPITEISDGIKKLSGMPTSKDTKDSQPDKTHAEGAEFPENEA